MGGYGGGGVVEATVPGETGVRQFDRVVLACGHRPGRLELPLLAKLCERMPPEIQGGLPVLSEDLQDTMTAGCSNGSNETEIVIGPEHIPPLRVPCPGEKRFDCGGAAAPVRWSSQNRRGKNEDNRRTERTRSSTLKNTA